MGSLDMGGKRIKSFEFQMWRNLYLSGMRAFDEDGAEVFERVWLNEATNTDLNNYEIETRWEERFIVKEGHQVIGIRANAYSPDVNFLMYVSILTAPIGLD